MGKPTWMLCGVLLPLVLPACGTFVTSTPLNPPPRPMVPRPPETVEVYASSPPARPHVDVALFEVTQTDDRTDTDVMIRRLRERAGEMGCDAVLVGGMSEHDGNHKLFDTDSRTLQATCIVYTPPTPLSSPVATVPH